MNKKDFLAVLIAFSLGVLLFTAFPTRSGLPYDPWADINEDGTVNMRDIGYEAALFGASGDPTKNVNVTNWPVDRPLFPETLVLKATGYYGERMLLDAGTPYLASNDLNPPPARVDYDTASFGLNATWQQIYNKTFIYQKPATHDYQILGEIQASITVNYTVTADSTFHYEAYLVAISSSDDQRLLTNFGSTNYVTSGTVNDLQAAHSVIRNVVDPIAVFASERLAVQLIVTGMASTGSSGHLHIMFEMEKENQFIVGIPIVENP